MEESRKRIHPQELGKQKQKEQTMEKKGLNLFCCCCCTKNLFDTEQNDISAACGHILCHSKGSLVVVVEQGGDLQQNGCGQQQENPLIGHVFPSIWISNATSGSFPKVAQGEHQSDVDQSAIP